LLVVAFALASMLLTTGGQSKAHAATAAAARCNVLPLALPVVRSPIRFEMHAGYGVLFLHNTGDLALRVRGDFPHANYMSFASYSGGSLKDAIIDSGIEPDAGSTNPFRVGSDVDARKRSYRLGIAPGGSAAASAEPTMLRLPAADVVTVIYRVYESDRGYPRFGGALPEIRAVSASNPDRNVACPELLTSPAGWFDLPTEIQGILPPSFHSIPRPDPDRVLFFRAPTSGIPFPDGTPEVPAGESCSAYLTAAPDPTRLAVVRINKLPSFYDNLHRKAGRRFERTDVRYLSLQSNGITLTTQGDSYSGPEMRQDRNGGATFVAIPPSYGPLQRAAVRAAAAARGYNVLDQGGSGPLFDSILVYRNKVPAPGFRETTTAPPCYEGADWTDAPASYASSRANMGQHAISGVSCTSVEFLGSRCDARLDAAVPQRRRARR